MSEEKLDRDKSRAQIGLSRTGLGWIGLVAVTLLCLVLTLLAAEAAIRIRQTIRYGYAETIEEFYTIDEALNLRVPLAGLQKGNVTTNSLGFRGPEIEAPKAEGVIRIAFVGGSTTWCGEVSSNDATWPALVAKQLRYDFPHLKFDYVNAGVPGYTVRTSLRNLKFRVAPLDPDIIVILHASNDATGELRDAAVAQGLLERAAAPQPSWLSRYSLLWNLAEKNFRLWLAQTRAQQVEGQLDISGLNLGRDFRQDLKELISVAKEEAKLVAVATFSIQLRPEQSREQKLMAASSSLYYMPFMTPAGLLEAFATYNRIISEVAAETGILLIGGEQEIPGDRKHFTDTVHLTDSGSRLMADRVARALSNALKTW